MLTSLQKLQSVTFILILCSLLFISCESDSEPLLEKVTLESDIQGKTIEKGAVIACAASDEKEPLNVLLFYYPKEGATNAKLYISESTDIVPEDLSNYKEVIADKTPVFSGYLEKFSHNFTEEKWAIITYKLDGEIKISNPIKIKNSSQPSKWQNNVSINQETETMPIFSWDANNEGNNAIYFEVVTNAQNQLLSGTYTLDNYFQYYKTNNVVLNITTEMPPLLERDKEYHFTLMDVSDDNWVNRVLEKSFVINQ